MDKTAWRGGTHVTPALALQQVSFAYVNASGERWLVLQGLDVAVMPQTFVALVGPSGSGKSTLLRLMAGLLRPQSGEVLRFGQQLRGPGSVAYMPQRDLLLPWKTVVENAAAGLQARHVPRRQAERRVRELLPTFGLEGFGEATPDQLSGGMRQRAAFLRTAVLEAEPLLLDEPFGALDALTRADLQRWLLQMWEQMRRTVVLVTHDVDEALLLADQIFVISERPIHRAQAFSIDFPRPRTYEVTLTPAFLAYKRAILASLQEGRT